MARRLTEQDSTQEDVNWGGAGPAGARGTRFHLLGVEHGSPRLEVHSTTLYPNGVAGPYHYHPDADYCYYILSGRARILIEGEYEYSSTGEAVYIPAGEKFTIDNMSGEDLRVLAIRSPAASTSIKLPRPDGLVPGDPYPPS